MKENGILSKAVFIAAIGYFVDLYDLVLFGVVRISSLKELGYGGDDLLKKGLLLINAQTAGLLLGGIIWGVLGDKVGRVRALFGSILLFSLATFANAFVHSLPLYIFFRFITGIGLAGELGIGVTGVGALVSGVISQKIKSRRKTVMGFIAFTMTTISAYLLFPYHSNGIFYVLCGLMGTGCGVWAVGVLICAEQFGTNVRGTATTTISNFSRAGLLILTVLFGSFTPLLGSIQTALVLGVIVLGLAALGVYGLKETFDRDVDYLEK